MFALLIIPLLASGQIIISSRYIIKIYFRLHRYDGQLLYMKVATYGIWCLLASICAAYLMKWAIPGFTLATWLTNWIDLSNDSKQNRLTSWLILLSFSMVMIAVAWTQIIRFVIHLAANVLSGFKNDDGQADFFKQVIRLWALKELLSEGSLGKLFFDSATSAKPVLVSLKSRKVYVGTVNMISEPNEKQGPNLEVSINPIMSGYREKDNLRVLFSNDYSELGDVDTSVIFPLSEVAQASWFDMDTHQKVDNNREQKPVSNRKRKRHNRH
ncbi:hypothetical protein ABEH08_06240 [Pantoea agglomerans]|uniref:hypothetical protein n=1 Tax=Enterobacter agglomerans TaxID=549 RepID=UPI0016548247|nr:hypothetical protein [Pantoea agglomerans]